MMPAMRAVPSTSPFLASPAKIMSSVAGSIVTTPSATAVRSVSALPPTSTMCASPAEPMWVRRRALAMATGCGRFRLDAEQGARRGLDIRLAHQALADEERRDARVAEPQAVVMREDAALRDEEPVERNLCG